MTEKSSTASDGAPANARTHDLSINNNFSNRIFTRAALKTVAKVNKSDGFCSAISRKLIIKTGPWVDLTEAATMKFDPENTSIPAPKVHCSFVHKGRMSFTFGLDKDFVLDHKHRDRMKSEEGKDIARVETMHDGPWSPPSFTHADLNPGNILVRGQDVVAIIDWEFAGWYPHQWEYTSAWYANLTRMGWQDDLPHFLEAYPAELAMEINRQRWWGEFGH
ncbi:hypothetical protein KCU95_g5652, partial [Aureobasidium melanogenum]